MTVATGTVDALLEANAAAPHAARRFVDESGLRLESEMRDRLRTLLTEAVSDRVLSHAALGLVGQVRVEMWSHDEVVHARVSDVAWQDSVFELEMRALVVKMFATVADVWGTIENPDGTGAIWFEVGPHKSLI